MAEGFMKGIFGHPSVPSTGIYGVWDNVKKYNPMNIITTPLKVVSGFVVVIFGYLIYRKIK